MSSDSDYDSEATITDIEDDDEDMLSTSPLTPSAQQQTQQFFEEIPEEVRKLYDLRFSVYIQANDNQYISMIVNNKNKKTTMQGVLPSQTIAGIKQRAELQALIEALRYIYSTSEHQEFICVEVITDSVYLVNIVREWLVKWQHQLQSRPHAELLQQLWTFLSVYGKNIEINWVPTQSHAILQECRATLIQ